MNEFEKRQSLKHSAARIKHLGGRALEGIVNFIKGPPYEPERLPEQLFSPEEIQRAEADPAQLESAEAVINMVKALTNAEEIISDEELDYGSSLNLFIPFVNEDTGAKEWLSVGYNRPGRWALRNLPEVDRPIASIIGLSNAVEIPKLYRFDEIKRTWDSLHITAGRKAVVERIVYRKMDHVTVTDVRLASEVEVQRAIEALIKAVAYSKDEADLANPLEGESG